MAEMRLAAVAKDFGETKVIEPLDLSVEAGEFVVFVGPSGCGKSTLLRMIAGLEAVTSGQIFIGGKEVTSLPPVERGVAMVFQTYALYPHMTVEENIGFGLMIAGMSKREIREKVLRAATTLRLEPYLKRKPKQLSGGQRQRVAIGRAIVKEPRIFLFDEPLSNLDAELRVQMRLEIARLHQDLGVTMIYVTHDQVEAMTLADRIVVLRDGQIEQAGKPVDLYTDPANIFVAGFIGSPKMNFVPGRIILAEGDSVIVGAPRLGAEPFPVRARRVVPSPGAEVTVGFRPEHTVEPGAGPTFPGRVELVELLGSVSYVYVLTAAGERVTLEHRHLTASRPGEELAFGIDPDRIVLFDREGRRI